VWRTRSTLILTYVNQYSCSTRFQFGTNLTTDRKKDLGFTNHFWSISYFQTNPTKKLVGSYTDMHTITPVLYLRRVILSAKFYVLCIYFSFRFPARTDFKIKIKLTIADLNHNSTTESISVDLKKKQS
jgi:hypothetical protein